MAANNINRCNIRNYIECVVLHHCPKYAESAANLIAKQWNHKEADVERNIKSMTEESNDNLPCHLALILKPHLTIMRDSTTDVEQINNNNHVSNESLNEEAHRPHEIVVGHVKLMKVDGRSGGSCCISYSLVVSDEYRGLGLGRVLTEEAENYSRALHMSHMYLSTNDKV